MGNSKDISRRIFIKTSAAVVASLPAWSSQQKFSNNPNYQEKNINMKTVHVIGDSISIQYGPYFEKYIAGHYHYSRKEGKGGNPDLPEGANAGDSSMVLDYLHKCIAEKRQWDVLLINCGLHDIKHYDGKYQINPSEYEKNLQQIFDQAAILSRQIIWIRTTPVVDTIHNSRIKQFERYHADVEKYNAIADNIALSKGAWIIDLNTFSNALGGSEIYEDHVHFTGEVQKLQAAFIAGHIVQLFNNFDALPSKD